jgi:TolB-like protein
LTEGPIIEWLARVRWIKVFSENDAKWFNGAFANQNVVCEISDQDTVEYLIKEFNLESIVKEL